MYKIHFGECFLLTVIQKMKTLSHKEADLSRQNQKIEGRRIDNDEQVLVIPLTPPQPALFNGSATVWFTHVNLPFYYNPLARRVAHIR
jgi:hypothetical protein